jgi:hypothetical protein
MERRRITSQGKQVAFPIHPGGGYELNSEPNLNELTALGLPSEYDKDNKF